jgi:hypothetical protein
MTDGLLLALLVVPIARGHAQTKPPLTKKSSSTASIVDVPVRSFVVKDASVAGALFKLRSSDVSHVVVGFEKLPHKEGNNEEGGPISLKLTDTTIGDVVKRLCQADPRYEYKVITGQMISPKLSGSMIEVRPKGAAKDPNDLLNMEIRHYHIDKNMGAGGAIEGINEDAKELREFLYRKTVEWSKKTGIWPGSPGSIMSGNMPPPRFTLDLRDVTVRQILDAISLKSIQRFKEGKNYGPVGWEYDFVIKPNASTGLGGIPNWKPF